MDKKETLTHALAARVDEVSHYQINIDNYKHAIDKIDNRYTGESNLDKAMQEFRKTLQELHDSSVIEREKARIMLEVIQEQLDEQ